MRSPPIVLEHKKRLKRIFQPVFGVRSTQTMVKIYNTATPVELIFGTYFTPTKLQTVLKHEQYTVHGYGYALFNKICPNWVSSPILLCNDD